jgi:VanZ family protein
MTAAVPPIPSNPPEQVALRQWLPVIVWGVLIFFLSTSAFSASNTATVVDPILRWMFPGISAAALDVGHMLVRKSAHFSEYGVLFWLLIRGPMAERPYSAVMLCIIYALTDEGHQAFAPGRSASLYDVALDSSGALFSHFLITAITELA